MFPERERAILLVDCQSFYASVEKAARPELADRPIAVGDPSRKSGIILAACPIAKERGVTTASRVGEALAVCPDLVVIRPRMQNYIAISLLITEILESFTDQVEPYSIDEQFLDVTGSAGCRGSPEQIARLIQMRVYGETGVRVRVGIGPTKILAKMACDNFAKKQPEGIYKLDQENIASDLWPLPIHQMFMVASRMTRHFTRMGLHTIGALAQMELGAFKRAMRARMGRQSDIQAEYYWQTARGIDPSPVVAGIRHQLKSVGHGKVLRAHLYRKIADIEVVLLELVIEVCRRSRRHGLMGRVVTVAAASAGGSRSSGFSRQMTLPRPTSLTHEVAAAALQLFREHWDGCPVGRLSVTLGDMSDDSVIQLTLFDDRVAQYQLEKAVDGIKDRYGSDAIMRASSLRAVGVARERAGQIGGHPR